MTNMKKILIIIGAIILLILGFGIYKFNFTNDDIYLENGKKIDEEEKPISVEVKNIKEENFSGTYPTFSGESKLAKEATKYIENRIEEFKDQADEDVPSLKKEFGDETSASAYSIDMNATYIKSNKTESIVIGEYTYTGGANGNSSYVVFTTSMDEGEVLTLSDIIKEENRNDFTALVIKELKEWRPSGDDLSPIFEEEVNKMTFDSFKDWSLDSENLVLYFDKYEIGPGVLGSVAFPISLKKLEAFIKNDFLN